MARTNRVNLKVILKVTGLLLGIEGFFMLGCLGFSAWFDPYSLEESSLFNPTHDFLALLFFSGLFTSVLGLSLWISNRVSFPSNSIGKNDGEY